MPDIILGTLHRLFHLIFIMTTGWRYYYYLYDMQDEIKTKVKWIVSVSQIVSGTACIQV
jgi:hypothetical protein